MEDCSFQIAKISSAVPSVSQSRHAGICASFGRAAPADEVLIPRRSSPAASSDAAAGVMIDTPAVFRIERTFFDPFRTAAFAADHI